MFLEGSTKDFSSNGFHKMLANGHFCVIRCRSCGKYVMPPTIMCSVCLSKDLEWVEIAGNGKVVTFSEVHISNKEFQDMVPYIVAIIEMQGVRIPGILKDTSLPEVKVGSLVRLNLGQRFEGKNRPKYYFTMIS